MANAFFIVRAQVADPADRAGFDAWYEREHLPQALEIFRADHAWRAWSRTDPTMHYAFYEFASPELALAAIQSDGMAVLVKDFDHAWGARVTRSRDVIEVIQRVSSSG